MLSRHLRSLIRDSPGGGLGNKGIRSFPPLERSSRRSGAQREEGQKRGRTAQARGRTREAPVPSKQPAEMMRASAADQSDRAQRTREAAPGRGHASRDAQRLQREARAGPTGQ